MPTPSAQPETVEQKTEETNEQTTPAETNTPTETKETTPTRMTWDEIMKDPEYNKQMQAVVQSRLRTAKTAEENFNKLAPAVELLARKYNLDPNNVDYDALTKAINDDDSYYEEKALEMGVSVETARNIDKKERDDAREKAMNERTLQDQKIQNHFIKLEQQAEAMKKVFPNFDLRTELKNPAFARMTHPNVGISVEDAYYAVHRNEIQTAAMQKTAQVTAQKISNSIQSGSRRPDESGTSSQAPSVSTFNYRVATKDQRDALKKRIYEAKARGEKLYPGQ
jgi:phage anti-repressor protein